MSYPRPLSAPAWPLTIKGFEEKYWARPGLEGAAKERGGEVEYCGRGDGIVLAAAWAARKRDVAAAARAAMPSRPSVAPEEDVQPAYVPDRQSERKAEGETACARAVLSVPAVIGEAQGGGKCCCCGCGCCGWWCMEKDGSEG